MNRLHLRFALLSSCLVAVGFAFGWVAKPRKIKIVEVSKQVSEAPKRSIDCSKLIIVSKSKGETLTLTEANKLFLKIPDSQGGVNLDTECVKRQIEKYLNQHRGDFFASESEGTLIITQAEVVDQGNVRFPDPKFAFIDIRFVLDKS